MFSLSLDHPVYFSRTASRVYISAEQNRP